MMNNLNYLFGSGLTPTWLPLFGVGLLIFVLWSIVWKGLALWHSAKRGEAVWFIILLIVNTGGLLELVYLFLIKKIKLSELFK